MSHPHEAKLADDPARPRAKRLKESLALLASGEKLGLK
jgi:hypothetical protein